MLTVDEVIKQTSKPTEALNNMATIIGIGPLRFKSGQDFSVEEVIQKRIAQKKKEYRRRLDQEEIERIKKYTQSFGLSITLPLLNAPQELIEHIDDCYEEDEGALRYSLDSPWQSYNVIACIPFPHSNLSRLVTTLTGDANAEYLKEIMENHVIYGSVANAIQSRFKSSIVVDILGDWHETTELKGILLQFTVATCETICNPAQVLSQIAKVVNTK